MFSKMYYHNKIISKILKQIANQCIAISECIFLVYSSESEIYQKESKFIR